MDMKKWILAMALVLLLAMPAFAVQENSITTFNAQWDNQNLQIVFQAACKYQTIGTLSLSNGRSRTFICGTIIMGQTWAGLGGFDTRSIPQFDVTASLPPPCDVCSRTVHINPNGDSTTDQSNGSISMMWVFLGLIAIVAIIGIVIINKLKK